MTNTISVPRKLLEKMRDLIYVLAHREDSIGEDARIVGSHFPDLLATPAVEVEGLEVDTFWAGDVCLAPDTEVVLAKDYHKAQAIIDQLKVANYLQEVRIKDAAEAIDQLKAELDAERQRRWNGNKAASEEHREEIQALRTALDEAMEVMTKFRQCFVIAAGDASPFCKLAIAPVDAWLEANGK